MAHRHRNQGSVGEAKLFLYATHMPMEWATTCNSQYCLCADSALNALISRQLGTRLTMRQRRRSGTEDCNEM